MSALHTEADLAEMLQVTPRMVAEWRREFGWPCTKFKRRVRFTDEQIAQILASHRQDASRESIVALAGQTKRSARRAG